MSALSDLRDEAAKHPEGSSARRLLTWAEIHIGDQYDRICELEAEATEQDIECQKLRHGLITIKAALEVVTGFAHHEAFMLKSDTFAKDFAPFQNIMAVHYKIDPYVKQKRTRKPKESEATA